MLGGHRGGEALVQQFPALAFEVGHLLPIVALGYLQHMLGHQQDVGQQRALTLAPRQIINVGGFHSVHSHLRRRPGP